MSPDLAPGFGSLDMLRVANVEGDSRPEIVVAAHGEGIFVVNGRSHAIRPLDTGREVTALDTPDRDGDGTAEIAVGTADGAILVIDPLSGEVVESLGSHGSVESLAFAELSGDMFLDFVFSVGDRLRVVDGATNSPVFVSPVLGEGVGARDSLRLADVDLDGTIEAVVNTGRGLAIFGVEIRHGSGPAVGLTAPGAGSTVSGLVPVQVSTSDPDGVALVEFYLDGILAGADEAAPFSWTWDTTAGYDGPHLLHALAVDNLGHSRASPTIQVAVDNGRSQARYEGP